MRKLAGILLLTAISLLLLLVAGCDGEDEESGTPAAASATPAATTTVTPADQPSATQPPAGQGTIASAEEATDMLGRVAVLIDDLEPGYVVQSDEYADNAKASEGQADSAGMLVFLNSSGRLMGRTVIYIAEDITQAALSAQPVSFFSNVNAFRDGAGAAQYYAVLVGMIRGGTGVGSQFAEVFADPENVDVTPVDFPTLGDESHAFALRGQTDAEGQLFPVVVLLVSIRRGPMMAFVGSIIVGLPPDVADVETLAGLLLDRIDQEF